MLARTLHDHAIDDALAEWVAGRRLVGVMGGHAAARATSRRTPTRRGFGHAVGGRLTVATGGGPGAMEAANLGAYLSGRPADVARRRAPPAGEGAGVPPLDRRLAGAGAAPYARGTRTGRSRSASRPGTTATSRRTSFATTIAKYFRNALREAILRADLRRRDRLPAGRRRHRPGGLPGRLRELLRRRVVGRADGAGRCGVLDRDGAGVAAAAVARPRPADGEARAPRRLGRGGRGDRRGGRGSEERVDDRCAGGGRDRGGDGDRSVRRGRRSRRRSCSRREGRDRSAPAWPFRTVEVAATTRRCCGRAVVVACGPARGRRRSAADVQRRSTQSVSRGGRMRLGRRDSAELVGRRRAGGSAAWPRRRRTRRTLRSTARRPPLSQLGQVLRGRDRADAVADLDMAMLLAHQRGPARAPG